MVRIAWSRQSEPYTSQAAPMSFDRTRVRSFEGGVFIYTISYVEYITSTLLREPPREWELTRATSRAHNSYIYARASSFPCLGADFSPSSQRTRTRAFSARPFSMQYIWFESPEAGGSNHVCCMLHRCVLSMCIRLLSQAGCILPPCLMSTSRVETCES
jgi:hypothetical protein